MHQFQSGTYNPGSRVLGRPARAIPAQMQAASAAEVSSTSTATLTQAALQQADLSQLEGKLKIIGVGKRGASAIDRLVANGRVANAEVWCVDSDRRALDACAASHTLLLSDQQSSDEASGKASMNSQQLQSLVGPGPANPSRPVNIGDAGVAFVLAAAGSIPGGAPTVLRLVYELKQAGHFTAVALTRPFEFEGRRRAEAAETLISALEEAAHFVTVIEQDVLAKVGGGAAMTIAEATMIADNALEHTVRSLLAALQAPEILKSTQGALIWHGRDLRRYRRLLSPPLQRLLTCPGTAALGRGVAVMPASSSVSPASALAHLASDAVRAAAESPFLETHLADASAVLCCIALPTPPGLDAPTDFGLAGYDAEKAAARTAVQAAAGALINVTGQTCDDIVLCAGPREETAEETDSILGVEVSLLVLRHPFAEPGAEQGRPAAVAGSAAPSASSSASTSPSSQGRVVAAGSQRQQPQPPQRLPPTSWNAMSALAGGTAKKLSSKSPVPADKPVSQMQQAQGGNWLWEARGMQGQPAEVREALQQAKRAVEPSTAATSLGDRLVDTLTAQSLDLPPQAAKWRQQQRTRTRPKLIIEAAFEEQTETASPEGEWASGPLGTLLRGNRPRPGPRRRDVDIRERTSGLLEQDRSESWDEQ
ncbi:hypothetical protein WJX84_002741 [Apatococcus fuscideae]|uniref:Tubulin/FtsZ GTPase domain-containing protein n=1 Tax=Apatococcus fuscideae TaxID=2026836 RepID=A0AAW1T834_9CHLO